MAAFVSKCFTRKSLLGYGSLRAALPSLADASKSISYGYVKEGSVGSKLGSVQLRGLSQGHGESAIRVWSRVFLRELCLHPWQWGSHTRMYEFLRSLMKENRAQGIHQNLLVRHLAANHHSVPCDTLYYHSVFSTWCLLIGAKRTVSWARRCSSGVPVARSSHEIHSHKISFHKISFHKISFHKINFPPNGGSV